MGKHSKRAVPERVRRALGLRSSSASSPVDRTPPRSTAKRKIIDEQLKEAE